MTESQLGEWLQALKSGKYTQVQVALKTDLGYCCLGVLAELHEYSGYPDNPSRLNFDSETVVCLNDHGPIDQYARVICELESAPELYITSR